MRNLVLHMMTTTDGCIADTEGRLSSGWTNWDEQLQDFYNTEVFATAGTVLYGRRIYEEMVPAWTAIADGRPHHGETLTTGDIAFGRRIRDIPKVVVSTTLGTVPGGPAVIGADLAAQIRRLKDQPGGGILVYCGPSLLAVLTDLHLIDEYMIYINPIALGRGTHFFGDITAALPLTLARTKVFDSGVILAVYRPHD